MFWFQNVKSANIWFITKLSDKCYNSDELCCGYIECNVTTRSTEHSCFCKLSFQIILPRHLITERIHCIDNQPTFLTTPTRNTISNHIRILRHLQLFEYTRARHRVQGCSLVTTNNTEGITEGFQYLYIWCTSDVHIYIICTSFVHRFVHQVDVQIDVQISTSDVQILHLCHPLGYNEGKHYKSVSKSVKFG